MNLKQTSISQRIYETKSFENCLKDLFSGATVKKCRAIIAFVTLNVLLKLGVCSGGELYNFLRSSKHVDWVIGVDAVTTAEALEEVSRLMSDHLETFNVRAFQSSEGRLFHPKVYIFDKKDGTSTILVGSNNMTPGGLSENIEVSARLDGLDKNEMKPWNGLWNSVIGHRDVHAIEDSLINKLKAEKYIANKTGNPKSEQADCNIGECNFHTKKYNTGPFCTESGP